MYSVHACTWHMPCTLYMDAVHPTRATTHCMWCSCCSRTGAYLLQFFAPSMLGMMTSINMTVHVVNCSVGMVTAVSGDACQPCETGYYSFDPRNSTCDQCVPDAQCPGGALVLPVSGWWSSSPRSVQMHRCACYFRPIAAMKSCAQRTVHGYHQTCLVRCKVGGSHACSTS